VYLQECFVEVTGTDVRRTDGFKAARGSNLVLSDSGSCFRDRTFDFILLNPPYVPSDDITDRAVDGGKDGLEVAEKFLIEASRLINESGKILILLSSLNPIERFAKFCEERNLRFEILETLSLFFERLYVFQVQKKILSERAE
jgi:methylase of polypeptide subunit release factors